MTLFRSSWTRSKGQCSLPMSPGRLSFKAYKNNNYHKLQCNLEGCFFIRPQKNQDDFQLAMANGLSSIKFIGIKSHLFDIISAFSNLTPATLHSVSKDVCILHQSIPW